MAKNWIANAIVTFLLLLAGFGNGNTFLLYGALNILFIVSFMIFVPETKGGSLRTSGLSSTATSFLPVRMAASSH